MTTNAVPATRLKVGDIILLDGEGDNIFKAKKISTSAPGKHGHAKYRIVAIDLIDNKKYDVVMPHGQVEVPIIEKKNAQVLSIQGDVANVMDLETYETFDLKIPEELKGQVTEGCSVLYWEILTEKVMKQVKSD